MRLLLAGLLMFSSVALGEGDVRADCGNVFCVVPEVDLDALVASNNANYQAREKAEAELAALRDGKGCAKPTPIIPLDPPTFRGARWM